MPDREFLIWLHERLKLVHGESELKDYMHKLRAIICATPPDQLTPNVACTNSTYDLQRHLADLDKRRAEGQVKRWWRAWIEHFAAQL